MGWRYCVCRTETRPIWDVQGILFPNKCAATVLFITVIWIVCYAVNSTEAWPTIVSEFRCCAVGFTCNTGKAAHGAWKIGCDCRTSARNIQSECLEADAWVEFSKVQYAWNVFGWMFSDSESLVRVMCFNISVKLSPWYNC